VLDIPPEGESIPDGVRRVVAERAALQAKVAELEMAGSDARAERDAAREDVTALRVEVARLNAEVQRLSRNTREAQAELTTVTLERNVAESRLAAIRERAISRVELVQRFCFLSGENSVSGDALMALAAWVLKGAAPGHPERVRQQSEAVIAAGFLGDTSQTLKEGLAAYDDAAADVKASDHYNDGWRDALATVEERVRKALENAGAEVLAAIEGATP
jgi:hypothetical protein